MGMSQTRSLRKSTGGRYTNTNPKRLANLSRVPALTDKGAVRKRVKKTLGGNRKLSLLSTDVVNVYNPTTKKYVKAKFEQVVENTANRNYVRRNIITKGTVIKTDKGNVKITNRPGQDGSVNGILIK